MGRIHFTMPKIFCFGNPRPDDRLEKLYVDQADSKERIKLRTEMATDWERDEKMGKTDYAKLTADLKKGLEKAREAAKGDDGGSANLDACFLQIPGAREKDVVKAIKEAGVYCSGRSSWSVFGTGYFLSLPCGGQGNSNTRAVVAMERSLVADGWDVLIYYKMD